MTSFGRYVRTLRHLRPAQIAHRVRLRGQRFVLAHSPRLGQRLGAAVPDRWGWPVDFAPLDQWAPVDPALAADLADGRFTFLQEERSLGQPVEWNPTTANQLWRYNLHYFEWAWHLAGHPDRNWAADTFERLFSSWHQASTLGRSDAWSPYVASLRAWALCGIHPALVADRPLEPVVLRSLTAHASYIRWHLERDVGGNHLLKNFKALVGLGVFLDDDRTLRQGLRGIRRELGVQVLSDGGHYERSPSYHAQVLGDLVDVRGLLFAAGQPPEDDLEHAVEAMTAWLGSLVMPDGDVPLFNDCQLVGRARLRHLDVRSPPGRRADLLDASGYAVLRPNDRLHLVMDVGPPCPPDLPAHAHADALSFELSVDGKRVLVNSGTSTYQDFSRRGYERSAAAHNTVQIDGQDPLEIWGAFRAGRRYRTKVVGLNDTGPTIDLTAHHDGYRFLPGAPVHKRTVEVGSKRIVVSDEVAGRGLHHLVARLHVSPDTPVRTHSGHDVEVGPLRIHANHPIEVVAVEVAEGFGDRRPSHCLQVSARGSLPLVVRCEIELSGAPGQQE